MEKLIDYHLLDPDVVNGFYEFDCRTANKACLKRVVVCPDALDVKAFVNACNAIFGLIVLYIFYSPKIISL